MSAQVSINIVAESGEEARREMARLLGGMFGAAGSTVISGGDRFELTPTGIDALHNGEVYDESGGVIAQVVPAEPASPPAGETTEDKPKRARRTKAEMEAARAAEAATVQNDAAPAPELTQQSAISTGEERVGPDDAPEDEIQDMVDEQAETDAARQPGAPLTIDDVRMAAGDYVTAFGTPAAMEDGPRILIDALGAPPSGEPIWKMSIIPDDQAVLGKAVAAFRSAIAGNPFERKPV